MINLDRQPHRMARTLRELSRFQATDGRRLSELVTRIPAVDAQDGRAVAATADVDPRYLLGHQLYVQPDIKLESCFGRHEVVTMTRQEVAVARSHIEAWKKVAKGSEEHVLILEDDVWFRPGAATSIESAWRAALSRGHGEGPAMLYLSYEDAGGTCERAEVCGMLFQPVRGLWFLCGYVLSRAGARTLLRAMPVVGPVDMWINRQFNSLKPLAVTSPSIFQRLDAGSDNAYSVLPFLARAGIVDADTHSTPARTGKVRIIAWTGDAVYEPLAMALSMLGLRVRVFDAFNTTIDGTEIVALFKEFDVIVNPPFPPETLPAGVGEIVTSLIVEPIRADWLTYSDSHTHPWTILPGNEPTEDWWPVLCSIAGIGTPIQVFPSGAPGDWRLFRDDRRPCATPDGPVPLQSARPMTMDDTPWAIEKVDGWPLPVFDSESPKKAGLTEMQCSLIEPTEEMPAMRGTFPGNLVTFRSDAIHYGPAGATITLSESPTEDRPFRSGALSSARRFLHGRFEIEMRAAQGSGLVTGFFLYRSAPRQEIDVEITGNDPCRLLLNVYFNPGNEGTELEYGYRGSPCAIDLGFDASADFHRYAIEWRRDRIRWLVDDVVVHDRGSWDPTPIPHLPMSLYANLWSPRSIELAGVADTRPSVCTACFRNVRVESIS